MITRQDLKKYTLGCGIEIGAYHNPFPVNPGVEVTYIDKMPYDELIKMRDADPNLPKDIPIARVDCVDDGEFLFTVQDCSQDFVISSHQLEHCYSPLTAISNHLRVLKPGGYVIYAVPDMRFTFDKDRKPTEDEELIRIDYELNKDNREYHQIKKRELYMSYFRDVDKITDPIKLMEKSDEAYRNGSDVHFHCWTYQSLQDMFHLYMLARGKHGIEIPVFENAGHENFVVLQKL